MYKDFDVFIRLCRDFAPNLKLNLTTNGSFPQNRYLQMTGVQSWARTLLPILSDVKISWNGATKATAERIMKNSSFDKTMGNLQTFLAMRDEIAASGGNRASVTLQLTFMEANIGEFPEIVRLAASLGVDRVKGHHLWTHWEAMAGEGMRRSSASIARWNSIAEESRAVAAATPRKGGGVVALHGFANLSAAAESVPPAAACPFLGNELWVNTEGDIAPCCAPDKERAELGPLGRVSLPGDILTAWRSPAYRRLLRNYPTKAVCKKCTMRR